MNTWTTSEAANLVLQWIFVLNLIRHTFFPVSIVNVTIIKMKPDESLIHSKKSISWDNPKRLGEVISPVVFPKMCFSKKQRSPGFLGLFNIIISCIFRENFIAIPEAVQKLRRFCSSISTTFTNFSDFLTFPCYKETWRQHITDEIKILLPSTYLQ